MVKVELKDSTKEAMLDAIDAFGVYSYYHYMWEETVIFIVMDNVKSLSGNNAEQFLRERCPEWNWFLIAKDWLNWDRMESYPIFDGGGWV